MLVQTATAALIISALLGSTRLALASTAALIGAVYISM